MSFNERTDEPHVFSFITYQRSLQFFSLPFQRIKLHLKYIKVKSNMLKSEQIKQNLS